MKKVNSRRYAIFADIVLFFSARGKASAKSLNLVLGQQFLSHQQWFLSISPLILITTGLMESVDLKQLEEGQRGSDGRLSFLKERLISYS